MTSSQTQDLPLPTQESQTDQPWANKYKYQEFAPFSPGERLLKNILRKILPLALFETWQVLASENQANGNHAYLGVTRLAETRERTDRKVRQLLTITLHIALKVGVIQVERGGLS